MSQHQLDASRHPNPPPWCHISWTGASFEVESMLSRLEMDQLFSGVTSVCALTLPLWSGAPPPSWPVFPSDACTRRRSAQVPAAGPSSLPLPSCRHHSSDGETHNMHIWVLLRIPIYVATIIHVIMGITITSHTLETIISWSFLKRNELELGKHPPCYWHCASSRPTKGLINFGCLPDLRKNSLVLSFLCASSENIKNTHSKYTADYQASIY